MGKGKRQSQIHVRNEDLCSEEAHVDSFDIHLALKIIPNFSGESSELHKFISCCEIIYEPLQKDEDRLQFLNVLKAKLNGPAYDIVKYKNFTTWSELKLELKRQFSIKRSVEQLQIELINCKQKSDSVKIFGNKLEKLLSELNDACVVSEGTRAAEHFVNLNEKTALRSFEDGLNDPIKIIIKACRFTSLRSAILKATEEESTVMKDDSQKPILSKFPIQCQICNKKGHISRNCIHRYDQQPSYSNNNLSNSNFPNSIRNFPSQSQPRNVHTTVITCRYCHYPGHSLEQCRKKKYNDQKYNKTPTTKTFENTNPKQMLVNNTLENSKTLDSNLQDTPIRVENLK